MSRLWFRVLCGLCGLALAISLLWVFSGNSVKAAPPPAYTLRDEGGRVAVYAGTQAAPSAPLQICDIYTRLLPENDLLHLQEGIPVYSDAQLEALLEDLGL